MSTTPTTVRLYSNMSIMYRVHVTRYITQHHPPQSIPETFLDAKHLLDQLCHNRNRNRKKIEDQL